MAGVAAALTVGLSAPSGATPVASHGRGGDHARLDRVFIIVLENHSAKSVIGDPNTPFITSLAQQYGEAANYFGVTHPSEPNYIAMTSGSNWFINNDDPANRFDHTNVVDALEASHISWDAYMEAMPADPLDRLLAVQRPAAVRVQAQPVRAVHRCPRQPGPGGAHQAVYRAGGRPEQPARTPVRVHHAGPVQRHARRGDRRDPRASGDPLPVQQHQRRPERHPLKHNADAFVKGAVTTIMSSRAWTRHSAIFIVADEGDFTGNAVNGGWDSPAGCCDSPVLPKGDPDISASWPGGLYGGALVPAVVIDPSGPRHFVSNVAYNHYSMLRTIEDAWGLPELAFTSDHAQVTTMNEFLGH